MDFFPKVSPEYVDADISGISELTAGVKTEKSILDHNIEEAKDKEAEAELIKESVYIDIVKKEARACLAFIDDPEERLAENEHVATEEENN